MRWTAISYLSILYWLIVKLFLLSVFYPPFRSNNLYKYLTYKSIVNYIKWICNSLSLSDIFFFFSSKRYNYFYYYYYFSKSLSNLLKSSVTCPIELNWFWYIPVEFFIKWFRILYLVEYFLQNLFLRIFKKFVKLCLLIISQYTNEYNCFLILLNYQ